MNGDECGSNPLLEENRPDVLKGLQESGDQLSL
jgi:hypothetical protein